jgi:hypothetical protein
LSEEDKMLTRIRNKRPEGVLVPSHVATNLVVSVEKLEFGTSWGQGGTHRYFCQIHFSDRVLDGYIDSDVELMTVWRKRHVDNPQVRLEWSSAGIVVVEVQLNGEWHIFKRDEGRL